jgi:hypothetical protein
MSPEEKSPDFHRNPVFSLQERPYGRLQAGVEEQSQFLTFSPHDPLPATAGFLGGIEVTVSSNAPAGP